MDDYSWLLIVCCGGVLFIGALVVAVVIAARSGGIAGASFLAAAEPLGLTYQKPQFGSGRLEGVIENRRATVSSAGSTRSSTSGTIYQIEFARPEFPRFMITRKGLAGGLGGTPILSGDPDFDAAYRVSCLDRAIGEALVGDATSREAIQAAQPHTVIIEGTKVFVKDANTKPTPEQMSQMLSLAALLAARAESL